MLDWYLLFRFILALSQKLSVSLYNDKQQYVYEKSAVTTVCIYRAVWYRAKPKGSICLLYK